MLTLTDGCGEDMDVTPEDDKNADDVSDLSADDDDDNVKEKLAQLQEEENKEVKRSVRPVVNFRCHCTCECTAASFCSDNYRY